MKELQTVYDDMDQRSPGERINAAAPRFFVDAMKKYIVRNSIKITAPEFAFYCACTWEAQKHWLSEKNINWAIQHIVSDLPFPRLPADTDWYKPWQELQAEQYRKYREIEEKKVETLRLENKKAKPTQEQIAKVEKIVKETIKKMNTQ